MILFLFEFRGLYHLIIPVLSENRVVRNAADLFVMHSNLAAILVQTRIACCFEADPVHAQ